MQEHKSNLEVSQKVEFSCCYLVTRMTQIGEVTELESYRYRFEATVTNPKRYEDTGRVISFESLKQFLRDASLNNYFLYDQTSESMRSLAHHMDELHIKTAGFDGPVSAELILNDISLRLVSIISQYGLGAIVKETKLRENANSYVTWTRKDN